MSTTNQLPELARKGDVTVDIPHRSALARVVRDEGAMRELLAFRIEDARMALPLGSVKEILKVAPITKVPRVPAQILGILSVRGRITTVVCLRATLGRPVLETSPRSARILLVDRGDEVVGLVVDAVTEVLRLGPAEIEPAEAVGAGLAEHVAGIGRPAGTTDVVVLLDPVALLKPLAAARRAIG